MDPFLGEIRLFSWDWAPEGWLPCDGREMAIQQNMALFSLLGVTYGGDGRTTFRLPNLVGRTPVCYDPAHTKPNDYSDGSQSKSLPPTIIPLHSHTTKVAVDNATLAVPTDGIPATSSKNIYYPADNQKQPVALRADAISIAGSNTPISNYQPSIGMVFYMAISGIYPQRD